MTFYEYLCEFTAAYREHFSDPAPLREAACLAVQARYEFLPAEPGDLLMGRKRVLPVGFLNEPLLGRSVSWFVDRARAAQALEADGASEEERHHAEELLDFWETQETRRGLRAAYPEAFKKAMPEDIYWEHSQAAFPLYRVVGCYLDFNKLMKLGIPGMKAELARLAGEPGRDAEALALYKACEMSLDTFCRLAEDQARLAEKAGLAGARDALLAIPQHAPETFIEALQLAWLYSLISGVLNYGRMDDYLGDFLQRDLAAGRITDEEALAYLCSLWKLVDARKTVFHGRIIIGGRGRHNEAAADHFAMLAMEASRLVAECEPQLSLRFYEGQDPELMKKALDVIGEGKIYPMLYNDDVNIPSVEKAFGVSHEDAVNYCFFGCGEYVIDHKSTGSPNGIINLLKVLEYALHGGKDLHTGKETGLSDGCLCDYPTFDAFYAAYKEQLKVWFRLLAAQEKQEYDYCGRVGAFLYITMLMDDCLSRGRGLLSGGVRYLGGTLETYGNINTANSLYAVKKLVYEETKIAPETLLRALEADFEGYEDVRRQLLAAEKYGNDLDGIDALAKDLHEFVCESVRSLKDEAGLHSYMVVIINNEANTVLGRFTGASADGRKAGEPMANANNPAGGTDTQGVTAMLNSLVKLRTDIHAGAVQNMTFSPELFNEQRPLLEALLRSYFKGGGAQCMINVLNRGELEDAMLHPERHQGLMVRVGGFSARFVTLSPDVQREIASRTLY